VVVLQIVVIQSERQETNRTTEQDNRTEQNRIAAMSRFSATHTFTTTLVSLFWMVSLRWGLIVAFSPSRSTHQTRCGITLADSSSSGNSESAAVTSIDVSDLGLTMDDLEKPIPSELFGDFKVTTSGYQSTSRVESVDNEGCLWEESGDAIDVTLSIEGLRGQPVAAMDLAFSKTTCTVTVFGYAVWSCVLRGECVPESATYQIQEGYDRTPVITLSIVKKKESASDGRWGGFIETIGEDSIL